MVFDTNSNYLSSLRMSVLDFGPECTIILGDRIDVPLAGYYKDGYCEPIVIDYPFVNTGFGRSKPTSEVKIEVFRNWKGEDRLVFTRYVRIVEGDNDLVISFYGIKNGRFAMGLFGPKSEATHSSDNSNSAI